MKTSPSCGSIEFDISGQTSSLITSICNDTEKKSQEGFVVSSPNMNSSGLCVSSRQVKIVEAEVLILIPGVSTHYSRL